MKRSSSACLLEAGRLGAGAALVTAEAVRWSRMNATVPATNHPGESVIGF